MYKCTNCGEFNADAASRCTKCGVTLGAQVRAKTDAKVMMAAAIYKRVMWIAFLILVACLAYPAYRASFTAYYRYRLNTVREAAIKSCGENPQYAQKSQLDECLAADDNLTKAQADFDDFTKTAKK